MGGSGRLALFALNASQDYGRRVASCLGVDPAPHEERTFEDGEHKSRPLESVRGRDVYVLQSLYGDSGQSVNDKLLRLLLFLGTLRDAHVDRLTAVIPYLAYARKDRRTQVRDPVSTRYVAQLLESMGVDRVVVLDVHNPAAFENAFRIPVDHVECGALFVRELLSRAGKGRVTVVSPDAGGYKRAERVRELLGDWLGGPAGMAFMEKKRTDESVTGEALVGEVEGRVALIVDDLISTGGTLARAAEACRKAGASTVYAAVTHGLFTGDAGRVLQQSAMERLLIGDTVPAFRLDDSVLSERVSVIGTAPLVGEAIRRLHAEESLAGLPESLLAQPPD